MSLIVDGLLIATCLTAGLYCFVLSRRLKQFSSTEEGVGQQVVQLNSALEETRAALKEAQSNAVRESEILQKEIVQARKLSSQLARLIEAAENQSSARQAAPVPEPRHDRKSRAADPIDIQAQPELEPATDAGPAMAEEEIEEVNLDEALGASSGEQQLGFLPEPDETFEEAPLEDDAIEREAPDNEPQPETQTAPEGTAPAASRGKSTRKDEDETSENLLKVERMAL